MKKMLLISLGLLTIAGAAFAGNNNGVMAYLSWASGNKTTTNTASGAANNLFVRLERATAMDFKGAEIDLIWSPTRDAEWFGCFERLGSFFQTSSSCTTSGYLNRGSNVPVTTLDDPNHYHVAWASDLSSACTQGNACRIQFETDLCSDYGRSDNSGCFNLTAMQVLDSNSVIDQAIVAGAVATVDNGTQYCATPVEPTTWGSIKGLYNR
jgi:hypothetical protein